eukprot:c23377_g1_i1.p1 GENE.c23377_g1_i1~~c23377_g1_i1.p1  ORF type:complete len:269 (+),score=62.92 c23377_g1_i1:35-808(+)
MIGPNESPGICSRAITELFRVARTERGADWRYTFSVALLEIYNEQIRDLLAKEADMGKVLDVKQYEGPNGSSVGVPDLTHVPITHGTTDEVLAIMAAGMANRAIGCTNLNEHSSRSHCVFTVTIEGFNTTTGIKAHGQLHLVDLAGSERVGKSQSKGMRLVEAQHINKSLAALGNVISSLVSRTTHIPYRNSKLTYLLKDSLGGDSKTLMFCNMNPFNYWETLSSLQFASRVRAVELGPAKTHVEVADNSKKGDDGF